MARTGLVVAIVAVAAVVVAWVFEPIHALVLVLLALVAWFVHALLFRRLAAWPWWLRAGASLAVALLAIQLVPYGRAHTNPPVVQEPGWDTPRTRELAVAACYDCHSNETKWPWYTSVAPVSWITQRHVEEGRDKLNFSEWPSDEADEASETVREGEMPLADYVLMHPAARLSDADKHALADSFDRMFGDEGDDEDD